MAPLHVLIVGAGGREHALAWRLSRDPGPVQVLVTPGNDGMRVRYPCAAVDPLDAGALARLARERRIDLIVFGPEEPLSLGISDQLTEAGFAVFGPSRAAAQIESSKWFAKQLMERAGIPTPRAESHETVRAAQAALKRFGPPYVIKADGLAGGKGVLVARDPRAAERGLADCLEGRRFGASGARVLIEEFVEGEEVSVMAVCDGRDCVLLPAARDYKRAFERDRGLNTGGMGAFAPVERVDAALETEIERRVMLPALAALAEAGSPFRGVLFAGLMLTAAGIRVLEFNARFGDPESQAVLPLVEGDLSALLASAARGALDRSLISRSKDSAVVAALVDEGYPDQTPRGGVIDGLDQLMSRDDVLVFHAGARREEERWVFSGGRAAYVAACGPDRELARARVYAGIAALEGEGWRVRDDIGAPDAVGASPPPAMGEGRG